MIGENTQTREPEIAKNLPAHTEFAAVHRLSARANALGSAIVEPNAAGADDLYVRLPGGACILITRGHVFTYWCDDGGACTGIIHRQPDGGGECDQIGCDDDLIG